MTSGSPKRCLFGKPKPEEINQFLDENLKKLQDEKIEEIKTKYGFDISKNCSISSSDWKWSKSTDGPEYFKFKVPKKSKTVLKRVSRKNFKIRTKKLKNIENQIKKDCIIQW